MSPLPLGYATANFPQSDMFGAIVQVIVNVGDTQWMIISILAVFLEPVFHSGQPNFCHYH